LSTFYSICLFDFINDLIENGTNEDGFSTQITRDPFLPFFNYFAKKLQNLTMSKLKMKLTPGVNFIIVLRSAFTRVAPKSVKR